MNSTKNNEKHHIDALFRQKLSSFEIEPSPEVKEKFLASINQKESSKKPFWYFSAAAALLIVGGLSWLFLNNNLPLGSSPSIVENSHIEIELPEIVDNSAATLATEKNTSSLAVVEKTEKSVPSFKTNKQKKETVAVLEKEINPKPFKSITGIPETDELIQDKLTLALQAAENKKTQKEASSESKNSNELFQKSIGETIIIVASELDDEEIYLPEINSDSPMTLAQAEEMGTAILEEDRSFMAKVFTELKHLKHGEKASFNNIVASNEQSIIHDEDGFIGYESKQFKQRFKWLKGKISKQ